jgi:hypothetical protein
LFLLCWTFLSASSTFWLIMSSNISMKFSLITCWIFSFRVFLWASLNQEDFNHLSKFKTNNVIKEVIKSPPKRKIPGMYQLWFLPDQ